MAVPKTLRRNYVSKPAYSTPHAALAGMAAPSIVLGQIVELEASGRLLVEVSGRRERVEALAGIPLDRGLVLELISAKHPVVLALERGDCQRPILIGLVQPAAALREDPAAAGEEPEAEKQAARQPPLVVEADVDGRRVQLKAQDELVLRCGEASVTLRRNGRVIVRGTHVETYSTGVNRIKGGQVKIN